MSILIQDHSSHTISNSATQSLNQLPKKANGKNKSENSAANDLKNQLASQSILSGTQGIGTIQTDYPTINQPGSPLDPYATGSWLLQFMMQVFQWLGRTITQSPPRTNPSFDPSQYAKDFVAANGEHAVMGDLIQAFGSEKKQMQELLPDLLKGKELKKAHHAVKAGKGESVMSDLIKKFGVEKMVFFLVRKMGQADFERTISQYFNQFSFA